MFVSEKVDISFDDTTTSLYNKLSKLAYTMTKKYILDVLMKRFDPTQQNENDATFAPIINKEDEHINVNQSGKHVYNHIRTLLDSPGGYVFINDQKVKLFSSEYVKKQHDYTINTVVGFNDGACVIALDGGLLYVYEMQIANKKKMSSSLIQHGVGKQWINKEVK